MLIPTYTPSPPPLFLNVVIAIKYKLPHCAISQRFDWEGPVQRSSERHCSRSWANRVSPREPLHYEANSAVPIPTNLHESSALTAGSYMTELWSRICFPFFFLLIFLNSIITRKQSILCFLSSPKHYRKHSYKLHLPCPFTAITTDQKQQSLSSRKIHTHHKL